MTYHNFFCFCGTGVCVACTWCIWLVGRQIDTPGLQDRKGKQGPYQWPAGVTSFCFILSATCLTESTSLIGLLSRRRTYPWNQQRTVSAYRSSCDVFQSRILKPERNRPRNQRVSLILLQSSFSHPVFLELANSEQFTKKKKKGLSSKYLLQHDKNCTLAPENFPLLGISWKNKRGSREA